MHQLMHPESTLYAVEKLACEVLASRNVGAYGYVEVADPWGNVRGAAVWMVEADQILCLMERLKVIQQ